MFKTAQFISISKKSYDAADLHIDDETSVTLTDHLLFDMETPNPVIVRGIGCIGYAIIEEITFTRNGSTKVLFTLKPISKGTAEAAYTLYNNQAPESDDFTAKVPGVYQSKTTGKADRKPFRDDDDDLPFFLK